MVTHRLLFIYIFYILYLHIHLYSQLLRKINNFKIITSNKCCQILFFFMNLRSSGWSRELYTRRWRRCDRNTWKSYICTAEIHFKHLLHLRVYNELTIDQLPVGLIAQLVRALHRYRRGHGFDSRSGLNFFQALFLNCLSWVYTAMIFICLKCISAVQIYDFHVFLSRFHFCNKKRA